MRLIEIVGKEVARFKERRLGWGLSTVAALYAIFCLSWVPCCVEDDRWRALFLGIWVIGVPLYFVLEWHVQDDPDFNDPDHVKVKRYEKNRDAARSVWLAVASFLTFLYFGEYVKRVAVDQRTQIEAKTDAQLKKLEQRLQKLEQHREPK
jgi:hypothetical protein